MSEIVERPPSAEDLLKDRTMRRRTVPRIAMRIGGAFAVVLLFFLVAFVVTDQTLDQIGEAEDEVKQLDRAKHASHHVAAMAREMYIHQAHTIVTFDFSHLGHYEQWVEATRRGTERLFEIAPTPRDRERAQQIGRLASKIDAEFERLIIPAIERGERDNLLQLHDEIDAIRTEVIDANRALAADFEQRSDEARTNAERLRVQAKLGILGCTGFAALAAGLLGLLLLRSVLEPISVLRRGAIRLAEGDLTHRIDWPKNDEFGELAETFNKMTAQLARHQAAALEAQRLRILGVVTAGVAHEINNPLGVILGYLKLIQKDGNASPERVATILDEAQQCQRIVADLLEVVRPADIEPSEVDLGELAREAVERFDRSNPGARIEVDVEDGVRTWADPNRLRQVFANLLGNAVDACPDGPVRIDVRQIAEEARVRVIDAGGGISDEERPRVFDPFFTTKAEGTGLGLAISRAIVEAHGGQLVLRPQAQGACFEIVLPSVPKKNRRSS